MNKEIKKEWLEALRSGEYKQATGSLRIKRSYCCLGVLCDISPFCVWERQDGVYAMEGETGVLPESVKAWAGLDCNNPEIPVEGRPHLIADINDSGKSFSEIADYIERYL